MLLHLHGAPYTQKPPLFYWLAAAAGAPLGRVTEFAARLPSALAGIATVAATIALGTLLLRSRRRHARRAAARHHLRLELPRAHRAARHAARALRNHRDPRVLAHRGRPRSAPGARRRPRVVAARRRNLVWLHASLALAVLTKGPVGWIVPLLAIAAYLGWERRLRELRGLLPLWGLALSILPGPRVDHRGGRARARPGFFHDAVVDNLFGRAVAGTSHAQPFHYYLQRFPPDLLPWLLLLPVTIWAARRTLAADAAQDDRRAWRFLLAWIATSVLFFSLASGKRLRYLLTIEPAFALLFAATLRVWLACSLRAPRVLAIAATVLGVGLLGAAGALVGTNRLGDAVVARGIAVALVATVAVGTATWILLARRGAAAETRIAVLAASVFVVQLLSYAVAMPVLDAENSPRPIAETAAALARPGESIGLYRAHDIANAVTYYEDRPTRKIDAPAELAAFFGSGGRIIVFEEEQLADVESVAPVVVRGRFRVRGETWLVAMRRAPAS